MTAHGLIATLLLLASASAMRVTEKEVVHYAKALDVARLDPVLPSQRLDEWLRSGPAHLDKVRFSMSDCDVKPDSKDWDQPLCVRFSFVRGNVGGFGSIFVGTFGKGISGEPRFGQVLVGARLGSPEGKAYLAERLSDLPRRLDEAASSAEPVGSSRY